MPELPLETERIYIHFLRLLWELNKVMHVERLSQWPAHWTCSLNNGLMTSRQGEGFVGRGNCTYHSLALQSLMSEGTPASLPPWAHRCTEGCAFQFLLLLVREQYRLFCNFGSLWYFSLCLDASYPFVSLRNVYSHYEEVSQVPSLWRLSQTEILEQNCTLSFVMSLCHGHSHLYDSMLGCGYLFHWTKWFLGAGMVWYHLYVQCQSECLMGTAQSVVVQEVNEWMSVRLD